MKYCVLLSSLFLLFSVNMPVFATTNQAGQEIIESGKLSPQLQESALIEALQKGGYVIYIRHASTDPMEEDRPELTFKDCGTQRNLSAFGKQQAKEIGEAFQKLHIPVGEILSSPYCRCVDTAKGIFGERQFKINDNLAYTIGMRPADRLPKTQFMKKMLGMIPNTGKNNVIISHTANLKEAAGIWPKPEAVSIVFKPKGNSQFVFIGSISPDQWKRFYS